MDIALIEDNSTLRQVLSDALQMWIARQHKKFQLHSFNDAEIFMTTYPDARRLGCIISDNLLPGISGFSLFKKLRLKSIYTPFIMISGDINAADFTELQQTKPTWFLRLLRSSGS